MKIDSLAGEKLTSLPPLTGKLRKNSLTGLSWQSAPTLCLASGHRESVAEDQPTGLPPGGTSEGTSRGLGPPPGGRQGAGEQAGEMQRVEGRMAAEAGLEGKLGLA